MNIMTQDHHTRQHETDADIALTLLELIEIAMYTVQKIDNYPKSLGKTAENYFHLLFPDEIKSYLMRRTVNEKSAEIAVIDYSQDKSHRVSDMSLYTQQVSDIRALCRFLVEQQDSIMLLISDKLDELEAKLSGTDVSKGA